MQNKRGFTLIELLIVIAIIAILAVVVFVALDPLTRFQKARDAQRYSDVIAVLDSIKLDQVDNGGSYMATITALTNGNFYTIGTCAADGNTGCTAKVTQAACTDLAGLVTDGYLPAIPMDPSAGTAAKTDYYISKAATGVITVGACDPENAATISVAR